MAEFAMELRSDPFGRIDKIPRPRNPLQPIFEAISNSLFSVRKSNSSNPTIRVIIDRDEKQQRTADSPPSLAIVRMSVEDNGEGFNDDNCESFRNTDSRFKKRVGGQGIGRLLWLKTFAYIEIDSIFANGTGRARRFFRFARPATEGGSFFSDTKEEQCAPSADVTTSIALVSPFGQLRKSTEEIAYEIIGHFLSAFSSQPRVSFSVTDNSTGETVDLNAVFQREIIVEEKESQFNVGGHPFSGKHCLMSDKAAKQHSLCFCAVSLPVVQLKADRILKIPSTAIADQGRGSFYRGYLSGSLLDERYNPDRESFSLPTKDDVLLTNEPTLESIQHNAAKEAKRFLSPHLKDFKRENFARVKSYIMKHPGYRHLLKQEKTSLEMIPSTVSDKDLDLSLYKVDKRNEVKERVRASKLLSTIRRPRSAVDMERLLKQVNRLLGDVNEASRSRLAEYVIRRRVTLQFFEDILGADQDSSIPLEDAVHNLIFPMRTTSNEVRLDETNLWIVDERFAYHQFLSSDKVAYKSMSAVKLDSGGKKLMRKRHDLLVGFSQSDVFKHSIASASDPLTIDTLAIVEFKRPQRDDYTSADNPIEQTTEYASDIREGRIYNFRKQKIDIPKEQPIFCYIICDITPSLKAIARGRGFIEVPGGDGYSFINEPLKMFVTITSYRKLLLDAQKRNEALFDRLHIPLELGTFTNVMNAR